MKCIGNGSFGTSSSMWTFENWTRTRSHVVPMRSTPTDVTQLVAAVREAERVDGVMKAIGSGWSYPDVAVAPEVTWAISTDELKKNLTGTDATNPDHVIPFALRDTIRNTPAGAARGGTRHYLHVEAGMKVHDL